MDIFRVLESGKKLNPNESEIFISLLGNPSVAKRIQRFDEFYYVWVIYHNRYYNSLELEIYHSYYYLYLKDNEWKLRIATYLYAEEPEDIFEFNLNKLPYNASSMLTYLHLCMEGINPKQTINPTLEKNCIFKLDRMNIKMASESEIGEKSLDGLTDDMRYNLFRLVHFFKNCYNFESFRKGLRNVNILDCGLKYDCRAFFIKFMPAPTFPCELLEPSDWCQMKPTHVFQAVCNTCKKVFLACKVHIFERFGARHWDIDWQLAVNTAFHLYEMHQNRCNKSIPLTHLEIFRHPAEQSCLATYRKMLFVLNKNKTDENRIAYQVARRVYGFSCLDNGTNIQLTEILGCEI